MKRVLVAAWAGSNNLGDELLLEATIRMLRRRKADPVVISVDPDRTSREFDVEAVPHLNPLALRRAFESAAAMVFGGGGLLQDETSAWNLPYHLARLRMADRRGLPWAGIGLGASGITTERGRRQVQRGLTHHTEIVARDEESKDDLEDLGIQRVILGADLAWLLEPSRVAADDVITVTLRLPQSGRLLPGAITRPRGRDPEWVRTMAAALDGLARSMECSIRFVALESGSDDVLHRQVAAHVTVPHDLLTPTRQELLATMAASRGCVSMRYHGIITAAMAAVPGVALTFSPKLAAIAGDLGLPAIAPTPAALERLPDLLASPRPEAIAARAAGLRTRARVSEQAIDRLLGLS